MTHGNRHAPGIEAALYGAWQRSKHSVSLLMVWLCVGVFLAVALLDMLHIVSRQTTVGFLGLSYVGMVQRRWLHQIVTAPLVHANLMHLLFNMLALWMLGPDVESRLGRRSYIRFSVVCAVASMAASLLFTWGTGAVAVGYSGVIFGILVAQALFFPERTIIVFWVFPMKMRYAAILFAAIALYCMGTAGPGGAMAHAAHFFGAAAAYLYLRPPAWLRSFGLAPASHTPARRSHVSDQAIDLRSRLRRMLYRFREWKYRVTRAFR